MTRTVALDIEAVPTTPEPQFSDPTAWDPFAIAMSHCPAAETAPETTVLVRSGGDSRDCRQLLCAAANWIHDCSPPSLMGYNSESFDMPILRHCTDEIDDAPLRHHVRAAWDRDHRDLFGDVKDGLEPDESWPKLEEALRARGIESPVTKLDGDEVTGALMPALGARILNGESLGEYEEHALRKYAASDVTPLHELRDALDRERQERIEAEARAATEANR